MSSKAGQIAKRVRNTKSRHTELRKTEKKSRKRGLYIGQNHK